MFKILSRFSKHFLRASLITGSFYSFQKYSQMKVGFMELNNPYEETKDYLVRGESHSGEILGTGVYLGNNLVVFGGLSKKSYDLIISKKVRLFTCSMELKSIQYEVAYTQESEGFACLRLKKIPSNSNLKAVQIATDDSHYKLGELAYGVSSISDSLIEISRCFISSLSSQLTHLKMHSSFRNFSVSSSSASSAYPLFTPRSSPPSLLSLCSGVELSEPGYCISASRAMSSLPSGAKAFPLGLSVKTTTPAGVFVFASKRNGIHPGDVVEAVDGYKIEGVADLVREIRGANKIVLKVRKEERPGEVEEIELEREEEKEK